MCYGRSLEQKVHQASMQVRLRDQCLALLRLNISVNSLIALPASWVQNNNNMILVRPLFRQCSNLQSLSVNGINKQQIMPSSDLAAFRKKFRSAKHGKLTRYISILPIHVLLSSFCT